MGKGDFDGDMYFVFTEPTIVKAPPAHAPSAPCPCPLPTHASRALSPPRCARIMQGIEWCTRSVADTLYICLCIMYTTQQGIARRCRHPAAICVYVYVHRASRNGCAALQTPHRDAPPRRTQPCSSAARCMGRLSAWTRWRPSTAPNLTMTPDSNPDYLTLTLITST